MKTVCLKKDKDSDIDVVFQLKIYFWGLSFKLLILGKKIHLRGNK